MAGRLECSSGRFGGQCEGEESGRNHSPQGGQGESERGERQQEGSGGRERHEPFAARGSGESVKRAGGFEGR